MAFTPLSAYLAFQVVTDTNGWLFDYFDYFVAVHVAPLLLCRCFVHSGVCRLSSSLSF